MDDGEDENKKSKTERRGCFLDADRTTKKGLEEEEEEEETYEELRQPLGEHTSLRVCVRMYVAAVC